MSTTPAPGRIVHYKPRENQLEFFAPDDTGYVPALVVGGCGEATVNLTAWPNGPHQCLFLAAVAEGDGPGYWRWPPGALRRPIVESDANEQPLAELKLSKRKRRD